jgi:phage virion morphogenesis protein
MTGAAITAMIDDTQVKAMLARIRSNLGDLTPAHKIFASIVRSSIVRNFEVGGRPGKWKISGRVKKKGGKTLMVQGLAGGLAGSISEYADRDKAVVGTNKIYGAVHQFGAKKGSFGEVMANVRAHLRKGVTVRAHTRRMKLPWGDIPARPYLAIQDEDWVEMRDALTEYVLGGA